MIIWNKEKGLPEELTSWELKDEEASIWQAGSRESQAEGTREDKYFVSSRPGEQRPVWLRHSEHEGGDSQAVKKTDSGKLKPRAAKRCDTWNLLSILLETLRNKLCLPSVTYTDQQIYPQPKSGGGEVQGVCRWQWWVHANKETSMCTALHHRRLQDWGSLSNYVKASFTLSCLV